MFKQDPPHGAREVTPHNFLPIETRKIQGKRVEKVVGVKSQIPWFAGIGNPVICFPFLRIRGRMSLTFLLSSLSSHGKLCVVEYIEHIVVEILATHNHTKHSMTPLLIRESIDIHILITFVAIYWQ